MATSLHISHNHGPFTFLAINERQDRMLSLFARPFRFFPALVLLVCTAWTVPVIAAETDWPDFRGPWGNGLVTPLENTAPRGLPLQWSETENVKWKTAIHDVGWSSPVVLGGQVWLTTATPEGNDFFAVCVDVETGKILFDEKVFHSDNPEPLGNDVNCYASPSPVIEPGRVYVHFGSYGTACLDTTSLQVLWKRTDLPCRHYRGPGSSVVLFEDLLILTMDGVDVQYLAALDKATGQTVWKTDRNIQWKDIDENGQPLRDGEFRKSYTTPIVIDTGNIKQLISPCSSGVFSYDPRTGKELWKAVDNCHSPAPRPVFGNGLVYFGTGEEINELWAVRTDGQGDVTESHIAWKAGGNIVPLEPSPLLLGDLIVLVSNDGAVTCLEAATGNQVWSEHIGGNYLASPIYADGCIYCCSTQGKTTVIKAGRTYEVLATSKLDSGFMASPAVSGKAFILRSKTDLYRIEQ